jgi:hypothetical protein
LGNRVVVAEPAIITPMIGGFPAPSARAPSGQDVAPTIKDMNSRRLIACPRGSRQGIVPSTI